MRLFKPTFALLLAASLALPQTSLVFADDNEVDITLIHMGDVHGHLLPRPNLRSDGTRRLEGGLARMYTKIKEIREDAKYSLLINTGDTIQGSAEALYTRGQAMVDVINMFGVDAYVPGNWEFVYGTQRFIELFAGATPKAPWNTVAANVVYSGAPYADKIGQPVLPPYLIKKLGGIKIGILGFTTDRGPQVVSSEVTKGFKFLKSEPGTSGTPDVSEVEAELRKQIEHLRTVEQVDLLVVISELGLANNIVLAQRNAGIDVILSSDMHEETAEAVVVPGTGTIIVEEGQDGTMLGRMTLTFKNKKLDAWKWKAYTIDSRISPDKRVAAKIAEVRKPFVSGSFVPQVNPINGSTLKTPIDTVIGHTEVGLHRSNFAHETLPAVVEGTSHQFLTDAFRAIAGTQVGAIRGFRYGTHVAPGKFKLEDLYHYMPIGAQIAKGTVAGQSLKNQIEQPADGSLNPDPRNWTGGWLFGFSGMSFDLDVYKPAGTKSSNILVNGAALELPTRYSYASYWFAADPGLINRVPAQGILVAIRGTDGKATFVTPSLITPDNAMDGTEVVSQYLSDVLGGTLTSLGGSRVNLLQPLPAPAFINLEVQPVKGAPLIP